MILETQLIKILKAFPVDGNQTLGDKWFTEAIERLANHISSNVTIAPCKLKQDVWYVTTRYNGSVVIEHGYVSMLQQKANGTWKIRITRDSIVWDFAEDEIGKNYFFSQEEADAEAARREEL